MLIESQSDRERIKNIPGVVMDGGRLVSVEIAAVDGYLLAAIVEGDAIRACQRALDVGALLQKSLLFCGECNDKKNSDAATIASISAELKQTSLSLDLLQAANNSQCKMLESHRLRYDELLATTAKKEDELKRKCRRLQRVASKLRSSAKT